MPLVKILTPVGNEFVIDIEDLKHYPGAEVVEEIKDDTILDDEKDAE